jgi:hypothetical protein
MIEKNAYGGSTAPLYETKAPSGKLVIFSPQDLVTGGGKLKDPDGPSHFKPKKWKPHSMASIIQDPDFGKVKDFGK